ncbi:type II toxin-antitoxin system VapC family toxin [Methylomonas sp. SURF-2]|uniref:Type II toxin-antitoxin system VapC family toxin n=1 Tax=Methylomonas subterranea TaxID=2952225 RepID=A0ABT1TFW0_9GAMM|nr:type II toxin-antitoxin system VapC family toxin [Methylomonas sp. SURF-2]MCQ8104325.1 type II toxin-antitoxin system VapC family toxin [Methylomonas sp. SURF-2]
MKILLDTCAFLWLTTDAPELSEKARILFQNTDNAVYLSSVSVWEIIVKHQLGKLPLPSTANEFIKQECEKHFIEYFSLDEKAVFHLSQLPNHHRDPFDRMLVCQAIAHDLTVLTSDELIMQYPVATAW